MATSAPPTVGPCRPPGGPVTTAGTGDRVMLSPITGARTSRARHRRVVWTLALGLVVFLAAVLAAGGAWAAPGTPEPSPTVPLPLPTVDSCSPASPQPSCPQPSQTTPPPTTATTAPTPCVGEDCIPQQTAPPGPSTAPPPEAGSGDGDPGCGITNITGCIASAINSVFRDMVNAALSPILELLGDTALSTPTLEQIPGIGELWNNSWQIVVAVYGLFVLVGGIVVMSHESIQTRYSIKEIGPRIAIAFVASALSLFFVGKFINLANALALGVLGGGVNAPSLGNTLSDAVQGVLTGSLFIILTGLVLVVVGLGLLIVYVVRVVITLILIISGPLFLMCHALPHTDPLARWWWKAIAAVLTIQVAQSLVLITAVHTFLSGGVHLLSLGGLGTLISAIALFYILFKIPFWLLGAIKVSSGRSLISGLARAYVAARAFGMVTGHARGGRPGRGGGARGGGGGGGGGPVDPPWPTQPRLAPTPQMATRRLQLAHDAERARAARRFRVPSQAPQFLQPTPQQAIHDPAITPPAGPATPEFSARLMTPPPWQGGPRPAAAFQFQAAGGSRRRGATPPPARPIRVASVPPHLQFRAPVSGPAHLSRPVTSFAPRPSPAVFRPAHPGPRIGDARPRTPAVPPIAFRTPTPPPSEGGDTTP